MPDFNLLLDLNALTDIIQKYGYFAVFFAMMFEGACMPVPSELVLGFAGFLVYQGQLHFAGAVFAGWLGSLTGSFLIYSVARHGGRKLMYRWGHLVHLTPQRVDSFTVWFSQYGPSLLVPWRILPIVRTRISIAAGLLKMKRTVFLTYTALGIALWCTIGVAAGHYLGYKWRSIFEILSQLGQMIAAATVVGLACLIYLVYAKMRRTKEVH